MSRRAPSTSMARPASRAPSLAPRTTSHGGPRRATSSLAPPGSSVRVPIEVSETNINVVVRCRGRSSQEIAETSPVITTTEGPLSKAITIETTPPVSAVSAAFTTASSMAAGSGASTKTYPFDKVFGPAADQTMVFNEVADKMLDEVLNGYNCTIFAYGQTGTGKTYTMQGDLEPTPLMAPSTNAGIIPRVLHRLFQLLEAQENAEYAVKCTYVELYNEELRDLLAPEYTNPNYIANIKIYDDASKKGTVVQGLEEAGIRNLKDGLAILNRGSQRRQTAETKMNTESSRSHSIFTLTVHVKETSGDKGGEDLLRIGKFNLVDLAGSEAIGRSGAANQRAREAGMINQSLLTLGRVISALVDKGTHIPYRESKLTRLLQDSLGGRTKTCIVATVSPTRSNMEETLSTLEYALRAKSIKNKPEVNAHLTKAGLLKEYVGDIERLKGELFAAREKNGIYIPEEQWREMSDVQTKQASEFTEARQRVVAVEVELRTRKKEFEDLTSRFVTTTEDLAGAREAERQLGEALDSAKIHVEAMRVALDEERAVAAAYATGEERLHSVADQLRGVALDSTRDVGGLFDKLGRVTGVLDSNTGAAEGYSAQMRTLATELQREIAGLAGVQAEFGRVLRGDLEAYAIGGAEESKIHLTDLDTSFSAFNDLATRVAQSIEDGRVEVSDAAASVLAARDEVQAAARTWAASVRAEGSRMVEGLLQQQEAQLGAVSGVLVGTTGMLEGVISGAREALSVQSAAFGAAQSLAAESSAAEVQRLKAQNAALTQMLAEERGKSAKLRAGLLNQISNLVGEYAEAQDASLSAAVARVRGDNDTGVAAVQQFAARHASSIQTGVAAAASFGDMLNEHVSRIGTQREAGAAALMDVRGGMRSALEGFAGATASGVDEHVRGVDSVCARLGVAAEDLESTANDRAASTIGDVAELAKGAADTHETSRLRVESRAERVAEVTSTLLSSHAASTSTATTAHKSTKRKLDALLVSTDNFVANLASDEPTGDTPRKRIYDFPQSWDRTQPRNALIDQLRRAKGSELPGLGSSGLSQSVSAEEDTDVGRVSPPHVSVAVRPELSRASSSASGFGLAPVSSTTSLASLASEPEAYVRKEMAPPRVVRRKGTLETEKERVQMSVLGEGGNIPRRKPRA